MTTVVLNTTTRKIEAFSSARDVQARAYGHDSKAALEAATVPAGIPLLFLRSYAVAGTPARYSPPTAPGGKSLSLSITFACSARLATALLTTRRPSTMPWKRRH
jgi:hypothetical protein